VFSSLRVSSGLTFFNSCCFPRGARKCASGGEGGGGGIEVHRKVGVGESGLYIFC
jgi:hypothetical protein